MSYRIGPWTIGTPPGWVDITHAVEEDDPPFTLAKEDGVGALQFSSAAFESGERPVPTAADLADMVREFGEDRGFGPPLGCDQTSGAGPAVASGNFRVAGDLVRVLYVAERGHFLLVTYVCEWRDRGGETGEVEAIVKGIRLTGTTSLLKRVARVAGDMVSAARVRGHESAITGSGGSALSDP